MCKFNGKFTKISGLFDSTNGLVQNRNCVYPILDMIPAEPDTMKTAMVEAQRLTLLTGKEWTIFTNDQQLYQVAVNITWVDQSMFSIFVPRLGGMHMMMSFVGTLM